MKRSIRLVILGLVALLVVIAMVLSKAERPLAGNTGANTLADEPESKDDSERGKVSLSDKLENGSENTRPTKSNRENHVRQLSEKEHQYLTKRRQILEAIQGLMKQGLYTRHPSVNSKIKELSGIRTGELSVYSGEPDIESMGTKSKEVLAAIEGELEILTKLGINSASLER